MKDRRFLIRVVPIAIALLVIAYQFFSAEKFTNEAGRTARMALTPAQEEQLGFQSYQQVLQESDTVDERDPDGPYLQAVREIAQRLAAVTGPAARNFKWQVSVVRSEQANAFCLPGGKIVVYTGIIPIAQTNAALAAVMGHEMAHATARHGSERMFQQQATQTLMTGVQFSLGDMSYEQQRAIMAAIGAGAKYGILMPFGRDHESEADKIGLFYMARAGYDPHEATQFWERMDKQSHGEAPPEFMSTHPSHGTRIARLKELMPEALKEYAKAPQKVPTTVLASSIRDRLGPGRR